MDCEYSRVSEDFQLLTISSYEDWTVEELL
jgi:hypothetical protein